MDSGDYENSVNSYETDSDCDQKGDTAEDVIDQDVCDVTVLSNTVQ